MCACASQAVETRLGREALAKSRAAEGWEAADSEAYQWRIDAIDASQGQRVVVFTYATHDTPELDVLVRSASQHGIEVEVLGRGDQHFDSVGLIRKLHVFRAALSEKALPPEQLVLFTDGYDVVVQCTGPEIRQRFRGVVEAEGPPRHPVLIGAEKNCFPPQPLCNRHPTSKGPGFQLGYRFLNSGTFMGRADDITSLLGTLDSSTIDDQMHMMNVLVNASFNSAGHDSHLLLDFDQALFQTLHAVGITELEFDRSRGRYVNRGTGSVPCLLHGNGDDGKKFYERLATNLGLLRRG